MPNGTRIAGAIVALAVLAVPLASFAWDWRAWSGRFALGGSLLIGVGGLISVVNLYLSFVRPLLLRRKRANRDAKRHISGVPLLGMLVLPGLYLAPPSVLLSVLVLVFVAVDTGNAVWFVWATWNDYGLWGQGTTT